MLLPVQFLILAFAVFALARALAQFRAGHLRLVFFACWLVLWVAVGVVAVLPQSTTILANAVGVGRGSDLIVYVSLAVLFYLSFRLFVKIEDTQRDITKLVRLLGLKELGKGEELEELKEL